MKAWDWANRNSDDIALTLALVMGATAVLAQIMYRTFVLALLIGSFVLLMLACFSNDPMGGDESKSSSEELEAEKAVDQGVIHSP